MDLPAHAVPRHAQSPAAIDEHLVLLMVEMRGARTVHASFVAGRLLLGAFSFNRDGDWDIYVMSANGSRAAGLPEQE
jgi:hypothetical protein